MSPKSQLLSIIIQAASLSALSNALAQGFTAYQQQGLSHLDIIQFLHFVLFSVLSTPPNYFWGKYLEDSFPASASRGGKASKNEDAEDEHEQLSIKNTAIKFLLEQTLGAAFNTFLYIAFMAFSKDPGAGVGDVMAAVQQNFWPMILAGYNVWPLVTLLNLVVVPFDRRVLVGGAVGVVWGVYLNLRAI